MTERWIAFTPPKTLTIFGILLGLLAFVLLIYSPYLNVDKSMWSKGVHYQLYFALAVIVLATLFSYFNDTLVIAGAWLMGFGSLFFSGSFCLVAWTGDIQWQMVSYIGAGLIIASWLLIPFGIVRSKTA